MEYNTKIDTIGLRIEVNEADMQRALLHGLINFIRESGCVFIQQYNGKFVGQYRLYHSNTTIANIVTGMYRSGSKIEGFDTRYYIGITFAGLKRYSDEIDTLSHDILYKICAFLNTHNIHFFLTELDICIDMQCKFENVLAACTRRSPKTEYYDLLDRQAYDSTFYIEKITKKKLHTAVLRAYTYDKSFKENLNYDLTRFELKLQSKYFNAYGFSTEAIAQALARYHVMHFDDLGEMNSKIEAYDNYAMVKKREIKRMRFDDYRIYPDIKYITSFIDYICTVTSPSAMTVSSIR